MQTVLTVVITSNSACLGLSVEFWCDHGQPYHCPA